jgi:hypothetical protein
MMEMEEVMEAYGAVKQIDVLDVPVGKSPSPQSNLVLLFLADIRYAYRGHGDLGSS